MARPSRTNMVEWAESAGRPEKKPLSGTFGEFVVHRDPGDAPERARRYVAGQAKDADDARLLLDMLGLL